MARANPAARRAAREKYQKAAAENPPGEGSRFKAVEAAAAAGGARNPGAVAAAIGRRKYGKAGMARLSAQGRKSAR